MTTRLSATTSTPGSFPASTPASTLTAPTAAALDAPRLASQRARAASTRISAQQLAAAARVTRYWLDKSVAPLDAIEVPVVPGAMATGAAPSMPARLALVAGREAGQQT